MKGTLAYSAALLATLVTSTIPAGAPALAQERIRQVVIYGNDPCPRATRPDEVIVCARRPEAERFRLPDNTRTDADTPERTAWGVRARRLQNVGDTGIGSCSPVGPGGATGCLQEMIDANQGDEAATAPNNQPQ